MRSPCASQWFSTIGAMNAIRPLFLAVVWMPAALAQGDGMLPRWQVEDLAAELVQNVETVTKVVIALKPREWIQDGAPQSYVEQHATLLAEMQQVKLSVQALGREPERLSYAVETFLWLDRTDALLASLTGGVRRYYNGAVADLLDSARNRNTDGIATIKGYLRQLAVHVEQSMNVAHAEAQRCRSQIITQPAP